MPNRKSAGKRFLRKIESVADLGSVDRISAVGGAWPRPRLSPGAGFRDSARRELSLPTESLRACSFLPWLVENLWWGPPLLLMELELVDFTLSWNNGRFLAFLYVACNPLLGKHCFQIGRKRLWTPMRSGASASGGRSKPCALPGCCMSYSSRYGGGEWAQAWGALWTASPAPSQQHEGSVLRDFCMSDAKLPKCVDQRSPLLSSAFMCICVL